jgi:two-component system KDP operon response regulator KdpE
MNGAPEPDSKILVIEGEPEARMLLKVAHYAGGSILCEAEAPVDISAAHDVDFIVLDMKMPNIGEVVESLLEWSAVPIVIVWIQHKGGRARSPGVVLTGIGDLLHPDELLADIRGALHRLVPDDSMVVATIGELSVNVSRRSATVSGTEVTLTPTEFELLKVLIMNAGHVVTHEQLLARIWGGCKTADNTRVRIMIRRLREKIERNPSKPCYIITQPGVGYRLSAPDVPQQIRAGR